MPTVVGSNHGTSRDQGPGKALSFVDPSGRAEQGAVADRGNR